MNFLNNTLYFNKICERTLTALAYFTEEIELHRQVVLV